jgi:hypothetical protein
VNSIRILRMQKNVAWMSNSIVNVVATDGKWLRPVARSVAYYCRIFSHHRMVSVTISARS